MKVIEWIGVITGIVAVFLLYRNNIWTWPIGFINIASFLLLFWKQKLYGDFVVQLIFLGTGIWGWAFWSLKKDSTPVKLPHSHNLLWIIFTLVFIIITSYYFHYYSDCSYPLAEACILSLSITGQCLTSLRRIESWYYWILVDLLMICVYSLKQLYPTALYAAIILIIGIFGLLRWIKINKERVIS